MADTDQYRQNLGRVTSSNYSIQTRAGNLDPAYPQEGEDTLTEKHGSPSEMHNAPTSKFIDMDCSDNMCSGSMK